MKKLLQLMGCLSMVFLFACSDDDPKVVPAPEYVYHAYEVKSPDKDTFTMDNHIGDRKGTGDACYSDFHSTYKGGTYVFTPNETALFCNAEGYSTVMNAVPVYTLTGCDKQTAEGFQAMPLTAAGGVDTPEIKFTPGADNSYTLELPEMDPESESFPAFRLTFSCNFGEGSPYNNVKFVLYVNRNASDA